VSKFCDPSFVGEPPQIGVPLEVGESDIEQGVAEGLGDQADGPAVDASDASAVLADGALMIEVVATVRGQAPEKGGAWGRPGG
jgi:hypothetical protein